jgi:hypothetical protein
LCIVAVGFGNDDDFRAGQECGVKTDTELPDKVDVACLECFKEVGGA